MFHVFTVLHECAPMAPSPSEKDSRVEEEPATACDAINALPLGPAVNVKLALARCAAVAMAEEYCM